MFVSPRTLAAACAVASLTLAAPIQAAPIQDASVDDGTAYHIYQTPEQMAKSGHIPRTIPRLGAGSMEYFGGSVFSKVKVVSVIWGPNVNPQTVSGIGPFLGAMAKSTFMDQMEIYGTHRRGVNGHRGTHQKIERGSFLVQVQIRPRHKSTQLSDKAIREELELQIAIGKLPQNDPNTLYMIYFPANITIHLHGLLSCSSFGAYHEAVSGKVTKSNIFYGVEPDCGGGFVFQTIVSAHEFAEATTDNIPTPGTHPAYPQAWNTSDGFEIGDLCEGTQGTLTDGNKSWQVQQIYLNSTGACSTGNYTSP